MLRKINAVLIAAFLMLLNAAPSYAQTYPFTTSTYIPNAVLAKPSAGLIAAGTAVFNVQNTGTIIADVSGTFTGLAATFQCTPDPINTTQTWKNIAVQPSGAGVAGQGELVNITAAGFYRMRASGCTQVRLNVTAITVSGSNALFANWAGSFVPTQTDVTTTRRGTYSAAITGLVLAASGTDFFTLTGSASTTVRVEKVECSGIAAAAADVAIQGVVRSTANATGTSTAPAPVPHDSFDPAAVAVARAYTANPGTLGTLVGVVRSAEVSLGATATPAYNVLPALAWRFDDVPSGEELTLRGAAQVFALNVNAATTGATLNCDIQWTEE